MKKTLLGSAAGLLIMLLAGCGNSTQSSTTAPAPESGEVASATPPAMPQDAGNSEDTTEKESAYLGVWRVGAGNGNGPFTIMVLPNHTASNTRDKEATGTWHIKNGKLAVVWSDGWTDVIRKQGTRYAKAAFSPGADLAGKPSNTITATHLSGKEPAAAPNVAAAPAPAPEIKEAAPPVKPAIAPSVVAATVPAKGLVIVKAEWGADRGPWVTVTDKLKPRVTNNRLELTASNELFGDPAQGKPKKLRVTYTLDGVEKKSEFDENTPVMLAADDAAKPADELLRIKLQEPFAEYHPADGGRYLCFHLPKAKQIAVFETVTGKLVGTIALASDDVRFAAGKDTIYVAYVDQSLVMNYSLETFQRGKVYPLPEKKPLNEFAVGNLSTGPLFIDQNQTIVAIDPATGVPIKYQGSLPGGSGSLRVSADGATLLTWNSRGSQRFTVCRIHNGVATGKESNDASDMGNRRYNLSADGSLFFYGGQIYDEFTRPVPGVKPYTNAIPTTDPRYFIAVKGESKNVRTIAICTTGDRKALYELPDVGDIGGWGWGDVPVVGIVADARAGNNESRVVYLPDEKIVASIPVGNQEFQIRHFDLVAAIGENCLFVDSNPSLSALLGRNFEYTPHVISKHGGVKFELTAGPQGMTLAPDTGKISWHVPLNFSETAPNVIVSISDAGGQSVFHTFTLNVTEPPAIPVAIAPAPADPIRIRQPVTPTPGTRTPGTPTVTRPPVTPTGPRQPGTPIVSRPPLTPRPDDIIVGGTRVISGIQTTIVLREPLAEDKIVGAAPKIKPMSEIRGLVVSRGADGDYHGTAIDIIATASREPKGTIAIRGIIGREMRVSLDEAIRLIEIRHPDFDKASIDLSFGDKYSIKDGGSAGTAFAMVMLSAMGDFELNPDAAITGDITIDSKVRTIGEAPAKAHGAALDKTKIVAIPEGNASEFDDTMVLSGAPAFLETQIFTVRNIDEAIAVLRKDPDAKLVSAMAMFDQIKAQYATTGLSAVYLPATSEKLAKILELAPNHLSAKNLQLIVSGKAPKTLTALATVHEAIRALGPIRNALTDRTRLELVQNSAIQQARKDLAKIQIIADKAAAPVVKALDEFCVAYSAWSVTNANAKATDAELDRVAKALLVKAAAIDTAMDAVFTNKEVIDKLMHD